MLNPDGNDEDQDADASDLDPGDGGDGGDAEGLIGNKPTSKSELNQLREKYDNTLHLCAHLYKDLSLRDDLRMVYVAVKPFLDEYSNVLTTLKESQDSWIKYIESFLFGR